MHARAATFALPLPVTGTGAIAPATSAITTTITTRTTRTVRPVVFA